MERHHRDESREIRLIQGDITEQEVDAIVNAANSSLMGGGGVDGAIHRAAGPDLRRACEEVRRTTYPDGLPPGDAVATAAGNLAAQWVIHTVGPVYRGGRKDAEVLRRAYASALAVAGEVGAKSLAFPAISTGAYGYPVDEAADIAIDVAFEATAEVDEVRFVLFDERCYNAFEDALNRRLG